MQHKTLIEFIADSFGTGLRSQDGVAEPVALLWTDADGQWRPLLTALKATLPQLFEFGEYSPSDRRGPVIWLKCIVDRSLDEPFLDPGVKPILYLGGVSRQMLRAGGDCRRDLQPLVELQYRGAVWHQRNGRDWTVEAFLLSEGGLSLDVAQDAQTRQALLRALPLLAAEPVINLKGRRLEADDFDRLLIPDPIRDLLNWMNAPEAFEKRCDGLRWDSFKEVCRRDFGLNLEENGVTAAADSLLNGGVTWNKVWQRFRETPRLYPGVVALLREAYPRDLLVDEARRPKENERLEQQLGDALASMVSLPHAKVCERVIELDKQHGRRRDWVWAELGQSPYAMSLEPLSRLSIAAGKVLNGLSVEAIASEYASNGWRCDRAAIDALSCINEGNQSAIVARVVRALYEPWVDQSARCLQKLLAGPEAHPAKSVSGTEVEADTCLAFVDGLRFDVGVLLQERLEARGFRAHLRHRFAPIPTVTATAKPLAATTSTVCSGPDKTIDFSPLIGPDRQPATAARLRSAMASQGVQIIDKNTSMIALSNQDGGWTEMGNLDHLGHEFSQLLPRHIDSEVDAIADKIVSLLDSGWIKVRVVTDHGWLLLPGGLPKVELPPYLAETKWARCASVQGNSSTEIPTYPWYWNESVRIACPPGAGSFIASTEYAHGGVSAQECVIPELTIQRGDDAVSAKFKVISWRGMRCRVSVDTNAPSATVDLRLKWKSSETSIAIPKQLSASGEANLVVSDDKNEGSAASLVVLDSAGRVLAHDSTIVGEGT